MHDRCDKIFHCEDRSDEEDCDYFVVDSSTYNKKYPPVSDEKETEVMVYIVIEKIQNIKELDMSFDVKFTLALEWLDSRLKYKNLLNSHWTNLVKEENKNDVWIPALVFNNTNKNVMIQNGPKSALFVRKKGKHVNSPLTSVNEDFFYKGSENTLILKVDYSLTFQCDFVLNTYPFDTQTCTIQV